MLLRTCLICAIALLNCRYVLPRHDDSSTSTSSESTEQEWPNIDSLDVSKESDETQKAIAHYKIMEMEKKHAIHGLIKQFRESLEKEDEDLLQKFTKILNNLKNSGGL